MSLPEAWRGWTPKTQLSSLAEFYGYRVLCHTAVSLISVISLTSKCRKRAGSRYTQTFIYLFWPCGMQDLSFLSRYQIHAPVRWTIGPPGKAQGILNLGWTASELKSGIPWRQTKEGGVSPLKLTTLLSVITLERKEESTKEMLWPPVFSQQWYVVHRRRRDEHFWCHMDKHFYILKVTYLSAAHHKRQAVHI